MTDLLDAPNTTEVPATPSWGAPTGTSFAPPVTAPTPPPPPSSVDPTPAAPTRPEAPSSHTTAPTTPTVPTLVPTVPTIAAPDHQPRQDQTPRPGTIPVDLEALAAIRGGTASEPLVSWSRVFGTVFKIVLLAALVGAGVLYGPEYYERWFGDDDASATTTAAGIAPIAEEPPAPLTFPGLGSAPIIAAASFEIEGVTDAGTIVYEITTDFASGVSQTTVRRPDDVSLEVLTVGEQALIRRVDDGIWYRTDRGGFPFQGQLARTQWVRLVDELFPPELRGVARITDASQSEVGGVPARRLRVSLPAVGLTPAPTIPSLQRALPAATPVSTPAPATTVPASDPAVPAGTPNAQPPVPTAQPVEPTVELELWIDDTGIVRQAIGASVFGADRVTVSSTMTTPWAPTMPAEEQIRPLDADAVVHLGL